MSTQVRFESLGLRRGQNSVEEIKEAFARAGPLNKAPPQEKPPRLLSAQRATVHYRVKDDTPAEGGLTPHPPSSSVGFSIDSHLSEDDTWQFHTSWFRDGSLVWRWVAQVALLRAVRAAIARSNTTSGESKRATIRVWSCGCSSGEEAFSTRMLWLHDVKPLLENIHMEKHGQLPAPGILSCTVVGTDRNNDIINRANNASTLWNSTTGIPSCLVDNFISSTSQHSNSGRSAMLPNLPLPTPNHQRCNPNKDYSSAPLFLQNDSPAKQQNGPCHQLCQEVREECTFAVQDATIEHSPEDNSHSVLSFDSMHGTPRFDIIFCRYSIFLYCDTAARWRALKRIVERLVPGTGVLILGKSDSLPQGAAYYYSLVPCGDCPGAFRMLSIEERRTRAAVTEQQPGGSGEPQRPVSKGCANAFGGCFSILDDAKTIDEVHYAIGKGNHQARMQAFPAGPGDLNVVRASATSEAILRASGKLDMGFEARAKEAEERRMKALEAAREKKYEHEEAELKTFDFRVMRPETDTDGMNFYQRMNYYVEQRGTRIKEIREKMIEDAYAKPNSKKGHTTSDDTPKKKKKKKKKKRRRKKKRQRDEHSNQDPMEGFEDSVDGDDLAQEERGVAAVLQLDPAASPRSRGVIASLRPDPKSYFSFVKGRVLVEDRNKRQN